MWADLRYNSQTAYAIGSNGAILRSDVDSVGVSQLVGYSVVISCDFIGGDDCFCV